MDQKNDNKEKDSSESEKPVVLTKAKNEIKEKKSEAKNDEKKKEAKRGRVVSEVGARATFVRISPPKARLVINQLKGKTAVQAVNYLRFIRKAAVEPITKLLNSAIANAENNFSLDKKDLYIKKFIANDGPILKRFRPRAHGRSAQISKRTSHLELILGVKEGAKLVTPKERKKEEKKDERAKDEIKVVRPEEVKKEGPKIKGRGPEEQGRSEKGFFNKIFNRKTG